MFKIYRFNGKNLEIIINAYYQTNKKIKRKKKEKKFTSFCLS